MNRFVISLLAFSIVLPGLSAATTDSGTVIERRSVARSTVEASPKPAALKTLDLRTLIDTEQDYRTLSRNRSAIIENSDGDDALVFFDVLLQGRRPPTLLPGQWHALVNDLFAGLLADRKSGFELVPALSKLVREAPDIVIRDYALQHLAILAGADDSKLPAPPERDEILILLREVTAWHGYSFSGTALVNLYHLGDEIEDGSLARRALLIASNDSAHEAARSTALQIGVLLQDKRFLAPAIEVARRSPIVAHRASATRAIATFGGPEQRTLLLQLRRRGPEPITNIANEALALIENDR